MEHKSYLLQITQVDPPISVKLFSLPPVKRPILIAPKIPIIIKEFTLESTGAENNVSTEQELIESLPLKEYSLNKNPGKFNNLKGLVKIKNSKNIHSDNREKDQLSSSPPDYNNLIPNFNKENLFSLSQSLNKNFPASTDSSNVSKSNSKVGQDFFSIPFGPPGSDLFSSGRSRIFGKNDGISAKGGGGIFNSYGYDITPWAKRVVYRIKKNWIIPASARMGIKGQVNIYTIIRKGGQLDVISIKHSSQIFEFDKAAFFAIKTSAPFPTLPANFPYNEIEGLIVFHYN